MEVETLTMSNAKGIALASTTALVEWREGGRSGQFHRRGRTDAEVLAHAWEMLARGIEEDARAAARLAEGRRWYAGQPRDVQGSVRRAMDELHASLPAAALLVRYERVDYQRRVQSEAEIHMVPGSPAYARYGFYRSMRSRKLDPDAQSFLDTMNDGLNKLPDHRSTTYRGMSLPPVLLKDYLDTWHGIFTEEPVFTVRGFLSTSSVEGEAFDGPQRFVITGRHGKRITFLSQVAGVDEVLFRTDTSFRIDDLRKRSEDSLTFYLTEV